MLGLLAAAPGPTLDIAVDTQLARRVLASVCSGRPPDEPAMREDSDLAAMLAHFQELEPGLTMERYLAARRMAAKCETPSPDLFRFGPVVRDREALVRELEAIDGSDTQPAAVDLIAAYTPNSVSFRGRAVVMVGTPSCGGWSGDPDVYLDLTCLQKDPNGLLSLAAHEIYRLVQARFAFDASGSHPRTRLLSKMLLDGSATSVADLEKVAELGPDTKTALRGAKTHARRATLSFDLLDMLAQVLADPSEDDYDRAYALGLSEVSGAPLRGVGAQIFRTVERTHGREAVVCLLKEPPEAMLRAYQGIAARRQEVLSLGPRVLEAIDGKGRSACLPSSALPPPSSVQVMVLGTYHMAGSTADLVNAKVDDVRSAPRQRELAAVADALAAFRPTVIAIERVTKAPEFLDPKFPRFTVAQLRTHPNERVQIGYRLAHQTSIRRVYGIDEQPSEGEPDYFPFDPLMSHAQATGQEATVSGLLGELKGVVAAFSASQKERSIAELLIETNAGPLAAGDFYYQLMRFDRGEAQPGAELGAYWFMRNAKIFSKLMQVTKPGDRVVVVYGAGHKHWLEHLVDATPGYVRVDPVPFLRQVAKP